MHRKDFVEKRDPLLDQILHDAAFQHHIVSFYIFAED